MFKWLLRKFHKEYNIAITDANYWHRLVQQLEAALVLSNANYQRLAEEIRLILGAILTKNNGELTLNKDYMDMLHKNPLLYIKYDEQEDGNLKMKLLEAELPKAIGEETKNEQ